jgi:hypothetical protein
LPNPLQLSLVFFDGRKKSFGNVDHVGFTKSFTNKRIYCVKIEKKKGEMLLLSFLDVKMKKEKPFGFDFRGIQSRLFQSI